MGRYAALWIRNRLAAILGLALVAVAAGGAGIGVMRLLGDGIVAMIAAGLVASTVVIAFASNPRLREWAERMAAEERFESVQRRL